MSDDGEEEMPIEPNEAAEQTDDLVPLFEPGQRDEEEAELLEAWASAPEEEQIAQLTGRGDQPVKATIALAVLAGVAALVFMVVTLTGGGSSTDDTPQVDVNNQAASMKLVEARRAHRRAVLRRRAEVRQKRKRMATRRARQRARKAEIASRRAQQAEPATESSPAEVNTAIPSSPSSAPSATPSSAPVPAPAPAPAPSQEPAPATAGQAADAFGPGP